MEEYTTLEGQNQMKRFIIKRFVCLEVVTIYQVKGLLNVKRFSWNSAKKVGHVGWAKLANLSLKLVFWKLLR